MRLCTFRPTDERHASLRPGVVVSDSIVDLSPLLAQAHAKGWDAAGSPWVTVGMSLLVSPEGQDEARRIVDVLNSQGLQSRVSQGFEVYRSESVSLGPPVPKPGKIVAVARNWGTHVAEAAVMWKERGRKPSVPPFPTGFLKVPSAIIGPYDTIYRPSVTKELDYEVELAAVIGRYARDVSVEGALNYLAGYMVMNDISARDIQFREMENVGIVAGKNFETFAPMGPHLVTCDEISDPQDLQVRCWVNGEVRQDSTTAGMIFSVAQIVAHFSQIGLSPGDVIMTGSPEGTAAAKRPDPAPFYLKPGDILETEVSGIGRLRNPIGLR